ncbi:MAG: DMT family transporter [Rhodospirillaceae bacterium]|nr:DMT family transporter [Rhodospirillaceae bacterium]
MPADPTKGRASSNPLLGIAMMMAAIGFLGAMSVMIKLIGPDYHPVQVTFVRNIVAALVIVPIILKNGGVQLLRTKRPWMHGARALFGVAGNVLYFYAFARLALADVVVISQAVPLFVALMAVVFLREAVGWRRWAAISVGFVGVVVAVDPTGTIETATLATVAATVFWATTMLLMRSLGRTESPYSVAFYYMVAGTLMTALALPWVWQPLSMEIYLLLAAAGVFGAFGQVLMTYALKVAEASVVSPFNYTAILWGIVFDLTIWGVTPSAETMTGAAIITAAGLYLFRREALRKRT